MSKGKCRSVLDFKQSEESLILYYDDFFFSLNNFLDIEGFWCKKFFDRNFVIDYIVLFSKVNTFPKHTFFDLFFNNHF